MPGRGPLHINRDVARHRHASRRPGRVVATTVGSLFPGWSSSSSDADGNVVAAGEVGTVRMRSAAAMRGYVGRGHTDRREGHERR